MENDWYSGLVKVLRSLHHQLPSVFSPLGLPFLPRLTHSKSSTLSLRKIFEVCDGTKLIWVLVLILSVLFPELEECAAEHSLMQLHNTGLLFSRIKNREARESEILKILKYPRCMVLCEMVLD